MLFSLYNLILWHKMLKISKLKFHEKKIVKPNMDILLYGTFGYGTHYEQNC